MSYTIFFQNNQGIGEGGLGKLGKCLWVQKESETSLGDRGATERPHPSAHLPTAHSLAGPPASPAAGEFFLSVASASLPVSSGPFSMSPRETSASALKPHTCGERVLEQAWQDGSR